MEGVLQAVLERGQRHGEIDTSRDPREIASLLLGTIIGMRVLAKTADGPARLAKMVAARPYECTSSRGISTNIEVGRR